jgi:DNA-binding NarL/FixJ family response regulator
VIGVLVVDDHAVVRSGLERLIEAEDDLDLVGAAGDGEQGVRLALQHTPDVVLMDLSMPGLGGLGAITRIAAALPATRVVVLTSLAERELILDAVAAGAVGYLFKDAEGREIVRAVREAARGEAPMAAKAVQVLLSARSVSPAVSRMTGREREVLTLVGRGLPNKLVARELGISEKTVKVHLTRVFAALGVTDRTQAALWAQRNGLA